jgi:hypothetical protein
MRVLEVEPKALHAPLLLAGETRGPAILTIPLLPLLCNPLIHKNTPRGVFLAEAILFLEKHNFLLFRYHLAFLLRTRGAYLLGV